MESTKEEKRRLRAWAKEGRIYVREIQRKGTFRSVYERLAGYETVKAQAPGKLYWVWICADCGSTYDHAWLNTRPTQPNKTCKTCDSPMVAFPVRIIRETQTTMRRKFWRWNPRGAEEGKYGRRPAVETTRAVWACPACGLRTESVRYMNNARCWKCDEPFVETDGK